MFNSFVEVVSISFRQYCRLNSMSSLKSQSADLKKWLLLTQLLSLKASTAMPRVLVARFPELRFTTKTGILLVEFIHWKTVVLIVLIKVRSIFNTKEFLLYVLSRLA